MFCMLLRKHLSGAVLESIDQDGMERMITFTIQTRNEVGDRTTKKLIVELMGKHSNIMLVDGETGLILDSLKHISAAQNRHRTILPGHAYKLPPSQNKRNPLETDGDMLVRKLDFNAGKMEMQIVRTLTGFSPFIAAELVHRARLGTMDTYREIFETIRDDMNHNHYTPAIYKGKKEDFHVLPITYWNGESETFAGTNEMLDQFYSGKAERDRVKQQAKDLYQSLKTNRIKISAN